MGIWKKKCPYFHGIVPRGFSYLFGDKIGWCLSVRQATIHCRILKCWYIMVLFLSEISSFLWFQMMIVNIGSGGGLAPTRREVIAWTNDDIIHQYIYAPPVPSCLMGRGEHYNDITMGFMASQITSISTVYFSIRLIQHQRNIKAPPYWPFVRGIHRWPVNSSHKGPVTRKKLPFDDVIMKRMLNNFSARLAPPHPIPLLPPLKRHLM